MDQLPRLGKRELICLLLFTCNYVVSVWRGFLFLWVFGMGYVIVLWHSLSLPYNYFVSHISHVSANPQIKSILFAISKCRRSHSIDYLVPLSLSYQNISDHTSHTKNLQTCITATA